MATHYRPQLGSYDAKDRKRIRNWNLRGLLGVRGFLARSCGFLLRLIFDRSAWGFCWRSLFRIQQDSVVQAVKRKLKAISDAELVINFAQIVLHHLLRGPDSRGNFFVLHSLSDAGNDQRLFGGKLDFRARRMRTRSLSPV